MTVPPPPQKGLKFQGRCEFPPEKEPDDWGVSPEDQEAYVETFRRILAERNVWKEDDHDFYMLRRFLRSKKYEVDKATQSFISHMKWYDENRIGTIGEEFTFEERDVVLEMFPQGYHKTDKAGYPIYIQAFGKIDLKKLLKITTQERLLKFHIREYENCRRKILPACSKIAGRNIDATFGILDLQGIGLAHFTGEVKTMLNRLTQCDRDHYPEMLHHLCIINAPSIFSFIWSFVRLMISERTQSKIEILGKDYLPALLKWVDRENLPESLGGTSTGRLLDNIGPWNDLTPKPSQKSMVGSDQTGVKEENYNVIHSVEAWLGEHFGFGPHKLDMRDNMPMQPFPSANGGDDNMMSSVFDSAVNTLNNVQLAATSAMKGAVAAMASERPNSACSEAGTFVTAQDTFGEAEDEEELNSFAGFGNVLRMIDARLSQTEEEDGVYSAYERLLDPGKGGVDKGATPPPQDLSSRGSGSERLWLQRVQELVTRRSAQEAVCERVEVDITVSEGEKCESVTAADTEFVVLSLVPVEQCESTVQVAPCTSEAVQVVFRYDGVDINEPENQNLHHTYTHNVDLDAQPPCQDLNGHTADLDLERQTLDLDLRSTAHVDRERQSSHYHATSSAPEVAAAVLGLDLNQANGVKMNGSSHRSRKTASKASMQPVDLYENMPSPEVVHVSEIPSVTLNIQGKHSVSSVQHTSTKVRETSPAQEIIEREPYLSVSLSVVKALEVVESGDYEAQQGQQVRVAMKVVKRIDTQPQDGDEGRVSLHLKVVKDSTGDRNSEGPQEAPSRLYKGEVEGTENEVPAAAPLREPEITPDMADCISSVDPKATDVQPLPTSGPASVRSEGVRSSSKGERISRSPSRSARQSFTAGAEAPLDGRGTSSSSGKPPRATSTKSASSRVSQKSGVSNASESTKYPRSKSSSTRREGSASNSQRQSSSRSHARQPNSESRKQPQMALAVVDQNGEKEPFVKFWKDCMDSLATGWHETISKLDVILEPRKAFMR